MGKEVIFHQKGFHSVSEPKFGPPPFPYKKLLNPSLHFKKKLKYSKIYDGSEYKGTHNEMHNEMNKLNFYKWTGFFFHHILSMN